MNDGPVHLSPGEVTAREIIERLEAGDRVIVETELLGSVHEITLGFDGDVYYCDTPTTLHRHETAEELADALHRDRSNVNRSLSRLRDLDLAYCERRLLDSGVRLPVRRRTPPGDERTTPRRPGPMVPLHRPDRPQPGSRCGNCRRRPL